MSDDLRLASAAPGAGDAMGRIRNIVMSAHKWGGDGKTPSFRKIRSTLVAKHPEVIAKAFGGDPNRAAGWIKARWYQLRGRPVPGTRGTHHLSLVPSTPVLRVTASRPRPVLRVRTSDPALLKLGKVVAPDIQLDDKRLGVTELFCEGEQASVKDGLVWKNVCRTGTWKMSPMPGGRPLKIDEELFDDVVESFHEGAWEHVTVPLSHEDKTDENTGFVEKLAKVADPDRPGHWLLRAGLRFTEPDIKGKVLRGTIANTSVGISMAGVTRTEDKRFFPRVLKHVALTNKPWLNGLEPFGKEAGAIAASHPDEPLSYQFDYPDTAYGPGPDGGMDGAWNPDDDVERVRSQLSDQLSMYDVRPDGSIGTLDDLDHDGVVDAFEEHAAAHKDTEGDAVPIADSVYIRGMSWDKALLSCYTYDAGNGPEYAWVAPFEMTEDGPELSPPSAWTKVERSWQQLAASYPITYTDDDLDQLHEIELALLAGAYKDATELLLEWNPSLHPRWPGNEPGGIGGEFMKVSDILERIGKQTSGSLDVSFLAKGSDRTERVVATAGKDKKSVDFHLKFRDGSGNTFNVPSTDRAFDTARVIGALKEADQGGEKVHGHGDAREGQQRAPVDPFLEALTTEAENDPSLHPPIKKGRVTTDILGQQAPGSGERRPLPDGGYANTQQKHTTGGEISEKTGEVTGDFTWNDDRKELHEEAIKFFLDGKTPPPDGKKVALFFAGGTASGKTNALKTAGDVSPPEENTVHIDPDELKKWIPEYRDAALARDRYASTMAHEESSAIAKELHARAVAAGLNVIIDGTGNSGGDKFLKKLQKAKGEDYEVRVFMVDAPTEVAVPRAVLRGHKTGRFVPLEIIRDTHSNVSRAHLTWRNDPSVTQWELWSTAVQGGAPAKMAEGGDGKTTVHLDQLYTDMLGKGGADTAGRAFTHADVSRSGKVLNPLAPGGISDPAQAKGAPADKFPEGTNVQFERAGKFLKGTVTGRLPSGAVTIKLNDGTTVNANANSLHPTDGGGGKADPAAVLKGASDAEMAALNKVGTQLGLPSLQYAAAVIHNQKDPNATPPPVPEGVDEAAVRKLLPGPGADKPGPGNPLERKKGTGGVTATWTERIGTRTVNSSRDFPTDADARKFLATKAGAQNVKVAPKAAKSASVNPTVRVTKSAKPSDQELLDQAFREWNDHTAFLRKGTYYLQPGHNVAGRAPTPGKKPRPVKAPWSDLVNRRYPDNLDFHKAAKSGSTAAAKPSPRSEQKPSTLSGRNAAVAAAVASTGSLSDREQRLRKLLPAGWTVKLTVVESGKETWVATGPDGKFYRSSTARGIVTAVVKAGAQLRLSVIRITGGHGDLLAAFTPALHPRGLKGTHVGGKFIRKLFDAAENGNVVAVNEVAHSIEVTSRGGSKYHIEPAGTGVRVISYNHAGDFVRSALHTIAEVETEYPDLKGLTGLIRKKVRGKRGLVGKTGGGIKTVIHYGDNQLAASRRREGGEQMAEDTGTGEGTDVMELSQDQFEAEIDRRIESARESDRLELSKQRQELRSMRVDRRIRELEDAGHTPAVLKVARQLMLADDSADDTLTLSLGDGDNAHEEKVSWTGGIEALLAAIPEEGRSLEHSQPEVKHRADPEGKGEAKSAEERANEAWDEMHDGSAVAL